MSYEVTHPIPSDLTFRIFESRLFLSFVCPRCGHHFFLPVDLASLVNGFTVRCPSERCWPSDCITRPGYQLTMHVAWSSMLLSVDDRPLREVSNA